MPTTRASSQTPNATTNATTSKRILSPDQVTPTNSSKAKKNKTNKMSSNEFQELKNMIASLSTLSGSLGQKIDDSRIALENKFTCLDSKFSELASQVNTEVQSIKNSVAEFHNKITNDIDAMNEMLKNHANRLDNNDDDIQRVQLSQDVRLIGFAVKDNENLNEIFRKVATEIGFAIGDTMPGIERMPMKNHVTGQMMLSPTIIIHFNSLRQKQSFYSMYLNKMPLNPEKFGLASDNRIVIGEHLTRKNARLFKSAQVLRKNQKIAQTFTENGIVKIRFAKGKNAQTHTIRNEIELETTVAQNEANTHIHNGVQPNTVNGSQNATNTHNRTTSTANGIDIQQQRQQHTQGPPSTPMQIDPNTATASASHSKAANVTSFDGLNAPQSITIQQANKIIQQERQKQQHTPMDTNAPTK